MDISSIASLAQNTNIPSLLAPQSGNGQNGTAMFQDIFDNLVGQVNSTDSSLNADILKASEGELDNPEQLLVDSTKANIAITLVSNVRTAALDAYNDIIKMSV